MALTKFQEADLRSCIESIVSEVLGAAADASFSWSQPLNQLTIDSLSLVDFFLAFEEELGIAIPLVDSDKLETAEDVFNYLAEKLSTSDSGVR